jgi:uncharacterized protein (DUF2461 family)
MPQPYFTPATFRFLRALGRNNSREWFTAHKTDYERHVREPFLALIADMAAPLAKISPHYRADARRNGGSLFRIHRDTRFSSNKLPYKTWQGSRFFHARRHEIPAPSFYLHLEPGDCFAGGGMWHPESATLKNIRSFQLDFWGESLSRPPRGFDPEHELIEDLKRKSFAAGETFDDAFACSSELLPWVVESFGRVAPMIDYLCAAQELEF